MSITDDNLVSGLHGGCITKWCRPSDCASVTIRRIYL